MDKVISCFIALLILFLYCASTAILAHKHSRRLFNDRAVTLQILSGFSPGCYILYMAKFPFLPSSGTDCFPKL